MAKTKKVQFKQNEQLRKKQNQNNQIKKKANFNCVVMLESIDKLLREYNISTDLNSNTHEEVFNVGVKIRKGTFTVNKNIIKLGEAKTITIGLSFNSKEAIVNHCSVDRPVKVNKPKTLNQLIEISWRKCKIENTNDEFKEGQVILAKMRGWTPWPCIIEKFTVNKKRAQVRFFGTNQTGTIEIKESVRMEKANEVIKLLLLRSLDFFWRGIREAEGVLGISEEYSVTREQQALQ